MQESNHLCQAYNTATNKYCIFKDQTIFNYFSGNQRVCLLIEIKNLISLKPKSLELILPGFRNVVSYTWVFTVVVKIMLGYISREKHQ